MDGNDSCRGMTIVATVEKILSEGHALTLVELTTEVQRRGCRSRDDSRVVAKSVRASLGYRKECYKRDEAGRWAVVE